MEGFATCPRLSQPLHGAALYKNAFLRTDGLKNAKGAQCNSLGQRPRLTASNVMSAEGAECSDLKSDYALSALGLIELPDPGRCPGLLHFAPLALLAEVVFSGPALTGTWW
jgi:hypothetical protein